MNTVIIQESIPICPACSSGMYKMYDKDILYLCSNKDCQCLLKVIDCGQSEREVECEVVK